MISRDQKNQFLQLSGFGYRMNVYEDYFMECNTLGHERAQAVFSLVYNTKLTKDMKVRVLSRNFGQNYVLAPPDSRL